MQWQSVELVEHVNSHLRLLQQRLRYSLVFLFECEMQRCLPLSVLQCDVCVMGDEPLQQRDVVVQRSVVKSGATSEVTSVDQLPATVEPRATGQVSEWLDRQWWAIATVRTAKPGPVSECSAAYFCCAPSRMLMRCCAR